jgi:hypothetical protein
MVTVGTALGVKNDYEVVSAVPYDALVAGTDNFDVNAVQWNGHAVLEAVSGSPVATLGAAQAAYAPAKDGVAVTLAADQAVNATKIGGTVQTGRDMGAGVLVADKTGFALSSAYDAAKAAASQSSVNTIDGVLDDLHDTHIPAIKAKTDLIVWGDVTFILDRLGGKSRIVGNQLICYKSDNLTEICRFDLKNAAGTPSTVSIYEKVRV